MIKKIIFFIFLIFFAICLNKILEFDSEIIIKTLSYEIYTKIGFLLFLFCLCFLFLYFIIYVICVLFNKNFKSFKKNEQKYNKKINKFLNLILNSLILQENDELKKSFQKLNDAEKIYENTDLIKLLKSKLYFLMKNYKKSEMFFDKISNKSLLENELFFLKMNLNNAIKENNIDNIKLYSEKILKIKKIDKISFEELSNIYYNEEQYEKAINIFEDGLKAKIFNKEDIKDKMIFLYTSLGKKYYSLNELNKAKNILYKSLKFDKTDLRTSILLSNILIKLNHKFEASNIIKNTWKTNTNKELGNLYFLIKGKSLNVAKKLLKLNPNSYDSNIFVAKEFLKNKNYAEARKFLKNAEQFKETKELYELLILVEENDNGSSALIKNIKNKILNMDNYSWKCNFCKNSYISWQEKCDKCNSIDSIYWN